MADVIYNKLKAVLLGDGTDTIDFEADTIKVALVTSAYTPNQDTHTHFANVTNEVSGTGYTAGGATLAGAAVTQDDTNNKATLDATDIQWAGASFTARGAVMYKSTGVASTSPLVAYFDFGADKTASGGNFDLVWNASGILDLA